jgi:hypothetical protein
MIGRQIRKKSVTRSLSQLEEELKELLHLSNVGKDGAEPSAVFSEVLAALYDRLTMPIVVDSLNRSLLKARKTAEQGTAP